jgi:hypothetical protein
VLKKKLHKTMHMCELDEDAMVTTNACCQISFTNVQGNMRYLSGCLFECLGLGESKGKGNDATMDGES